MTTVAVTDNALDLIAEHVPGAGDVREIRMFTAHCNRDGRHHNLRINVQDGGVGASPHRFRVLVQSDQGTRASSRTADTLEAALESVRWTDLDA